MPESDILSSLDVQYAAVQSNLILVLMGLKMKYKIDQLCNYIILLTNSSVYCIYRYEEYIHTNFLWLVWP